MSNQRPIYFCNGKYVRSDEAQVSVEDLGVIRSFGLFESLRTYQGKPFLLKEHLDRLYGAVRQVGLRPFASQSRLSQIVSTTLAKNRFEEALVRIIMTGGPSPSLLPIGKGSLIVLVDPFHPFPDWQYKKGIALKTAPFSRIHPNYKSTVYFSAVMHTIRAVPQGFTEVVYVNDQGSILEGTTYSVFAVLPGPILVTPEEGVLPGITAQCVLTMARKMRIPIQRKPIAPQMLKRCEELFITSSNRELIPAVRVDRLKIGTGKPGPITQKLHEGYQKLVIKTLHLRVN